jgi:hypothetical protein
MSVPTPPTIPAAPTPAPTRSDPANFRERADAYHSWLPPFVNTTLVAALAWIEARSNEVLGWANAASADRAVVQTAKAAIDAQSPVTNAAAAAASAAAAAVYASQAQATNPDSPVRLNPRLITSDITIASAYNAASVGPIAIGEGVTVTVQDNATWSIH